MRKLIFAVFVLGIATANADTHSWQAELGGENTWSRLTFAGTLLAATKNDLSHFDPKTGELLWKRDDLNKLAQFNVSDVAGTLSSTFIAYQYRLDNDKTGTQGDGGTLLSFIPSP